jgi:hypothetical protein
MPPKAKSEKSDKSEMERWTEQARALGPVENPLRTPYDIGMREAATAAAFVDKYWEATASYPGLSRAKGRLPKAVAEEVLSLIHATQGAQTALLMLVDPAALKHGERARFVVDELEAAIEFVLDDGVEEPEDTRLAQIRDFHSQNGERSSALSQALRDYATLGRTLLDRIQKADAEFDPKLLDEAETLAKRLAETGGANPLAQSPEARDATLLRNQLLTLLFRRVGEIRSTAAYVYRGHPEILREVTSAYQRRLRAARRAKKQPETPPT